MAERHWMTTTGAVLSAIAGGVAGAAQLCPMEWLKPWLLFGSSVMGGMGLGFIGQGIRRRLPGKRRKPVQAAER